MPTRKVIRADPLPRTRSTLEGPFSIPSFSFFLRSRLYPRLLGACGKNVSFGINVTLRHPRKILIGDDVAIDDGCVLDAKGTEIRTIVDGVESPGGHLVDFDAAGLSAGTYFCVIHTSHGSKLRALTVE